MTQSLDPRPHPALPFEPAAELIDLTPNPDPEDVRELRENTLNIWIGSGLSTVLGGVTIYIADQLMDDVENGASKVDTSASFTLTALCILWGVILANATVRSVKDAHAARRRIDGITESSQ